MRSSPNIEELSAATVLEYYDYECARLVGQPTGLENNTLAHVLRIRLHKDMASRLPEGEKKERLLRWPDLSNKETFLVELNEERWYVQFWDCRLTVSQEAFILPQQ